MFRIEILNNDVHLHNKVLFTTFYVNYNDLNFPSLNWTDFPVKVLNMWADNIIKAFPQEKIEFELFFMDGPYVINCKKSNINMEFSFCRFDDLDQPKEYVYKIIFREFVNELCTAITKTSHLLEEYWIKNKETKSLLKKKIVLEKLLEVNETTVT